MYKYETLQKTLHNCILQKLRFQGTANINKSKSAN